MISNPNVPASAVPYLKQAQAAHDRAAIALMEQAREQLAAARAIGEILDQVKPTRTPTEDSRR